MKAKHVAQLAGPALAALTWWTATQWGAPDDMVRVLSAATWMLVWWVCGSCAAGGHFSVALGPVSDAGCCGRVFDGGALRLQVCVLVPWRVFDRPGAGAVEPPPPVCVAHLGGRRRPASTVACGIHGGHRRPQHVDFQHGHDPDDVAHRAVGLVQNQPRRPPSVPGGVVAWAPPTPPTLGASPRWWAPRPTWPWQGWWKRSGWRCRFWNGA